MGHFGKRPIRLAWFGVAMPALLLNYFGQGAMLLADPSKVGNPFFEMAPHVGALSADRAGDLRRGDRLAGADHGGVLGHQAGDPARLPAAPADPAHLGASETGQIYVPFVNWGLFAGIVIAVVAVRLERRPRRRLRHHGDDRHADHDDDDLLRHPLRLEVPVVAVVARDRILLRRRLHVPRRQHRQGDRRRLVPAASSAPSCSR